jgi:hypothetical protein
MADKSKKAGFTPNARKVRDLNPYGRKHPYGSFSRYNEYLNLLLNAVKIVKKGSGDTLPFVEETFAKRALLENNAVGYDKVINSWYYVYGEGRNKFGKPTQLVLVTANGRTLSRTACWDKNEDGAYIIYGLPLEGVSMGAIIEQTTDFMTNCDVAMAQNLNACKKPFIVVCKDENLRLSFEQAIQQQQEGQAVVMVSQELGDGLKAINISTDFLVDKFEQVRDAERDTLLNKLGILTSNVNKRERVQSAEVNATLGQATDYIYMLIDTFNKQCETYDLPFEMVFNGSMEEIYLNEGEDPKTNPADDTDVNDVEKGQKIND